jgi:hypothetical protein
LLLFPMQSYLFTLKIIE